MSRTSASRSAATQASAPWACAASIERREVAHAPAGAGVLHEHAEAAAVGQSAAEVGHDDLDAERLGPRAHDVDVCGKTSASTTKRLRLGLDARRATRHRLGRGGRLVEQRGVGDRQPRESQTIVWKLSSASSRPCEISGWYGV